MKKKLSTTDFFEQARLTQGYQDAKKRADIMWGKISIKIKPLTINQAWQGRRFKTKDYLDYEKEINYLLPKKVKIPKSGKLSVEYVFGTSSVLSDYDNFIKAFQDILQKKYGFNDNRIYRAVIEKVDVKKGEEFISFDIKNCLP